MARLGRRAANDMGAVINAELRNQNIILCELGHKIRILNKSIEEHKDKIQLAKDTMTWHESKLKKLESKDETCPGKEDENGK